MDLEYSDLMVRQAEYRSSCATVLMLDCSHSMILYGEDRFTPAKKVALALTHLIRTQFPGDTLSVVLFHDSAEEIPLSDARHGAGRAVPHEHRRRAQARAPDAAGAEEGHAADHHDHRRQAERADDAERADLQELDGARHDGHRADDLREVANCRRAGIMINTFMLARDRSLVEFVKRVSEISRGKAYFTNTMTLGQFILMDFLKRKTRKVS